VLQRAVLGLLAPAVRWQDGHRLRVGLRRDTSQTTNAAGMEKRGG
jgi:hypothetical protein